MFSFLYDNIHRFHSISTVPNVPNRLLQKGLREPLLCEDCEQLFSRYERYVSLLFKGGLDLEIESSGRLLVFRGVDYNVIRFFQLSILWRAGVSNLEFFSSVKLGKHQERLRIFLLNEKLPTEWQYGCLLFALIHEDRPQTDLIVQPDELRVNGVKSYRFTFGGFIWIYFVSNHPSHNQIETASLHPSGELRILLSDLTSAEYLVDFGRTLALNGKLIL